VAFSPDGKLLASGGDDAKVTLWDVATARVLNTGGGHADGVLSLAYAPDGQTLASGGRDATVRLWNPAGGRPLRHWSQPDWPTSLRFSADSKRLLSNQLWGGQTHVWEAATGKELAACGQEKDFVSAVGLSPAGELVTACKGGVLRRWDAAAGKELATARLHCDRQGEDRLALSLDGRLLALCTDPTAVQVFDIPGWRVAGRLRAGKPGCPNQHIAVSGRHLFAASCGCTLHLCELATGAELWQATVDFMGDCVAFSATGRLAAAGGQDLVQVFEVASGGEVARFRAVGSDAQCLAFAPDGRSLACGYRDSTILVWDLAGGRAATRGRQPRLSSEQQGQLWADLATTDGCTAYRAIFRLADIPRQAVPLLDARLRPPKAPAAQVQALIADLDSERHTVRENAQRSLAELGDQAAPALQEAARSPSAEVRRRARELLAALGSDAWRLRECRAVEVLENAGTPEARQLLRELAKGAPEACLTQEAKAALERQARKP
jgi:WD40 repeat protein